MEWSALQETVFSYFQSESPCKDAQTINISPLREGHAPGPIDMPFGILSGVPDIITHAKFYLNRLRSFSAAGPRKTAISYTFSNDPYNSTALYRADCDILLKG